MQKWDYAVETISLKPGVARGLDLFTADEDVILSFALSSWGEKGWELVSILLMDSDHVRAIFKKREGKGDSYGKDEEHHSR